MADKNPFASVGLGMFGSEGASGGLGQDVLAGLTAYGIDKSGLKDLLNSKGISKNAQGQWGYTAPAVPPSLSGGLNYQNGSDIGGGVVPPQVAAPVAPTIQQAVAPTPAAPTQTAPVQQKPSDLGDKILDNDWHGFNDNSQEEQNKFAQAAMMA